MFSDTWLFYSSWQDLSLNPNFVSSLILTNKKYNRDGIFKYVNLLGSGKFSLQIYLVVSNKHY